MYSACAQSSGTAEPVGRPRLRCCSGRSSSSQTCSGRRWVGVAKPSNQRMYCANILARGQFVMAPFSRKQGPAAPFAGTHERSAVLALTVSVIVVASPAGARWRLHLKRGIHHSNRIADHRIVRRPNAIADQFEETRINDFSRRIRAIEALGSVVHRQREPPGIVCRQRLARLKRIESYIMAPRAVEKRSLICDSPGFDVLFQPIGYLQDQLCGIGISPMGCEIGRAHQGRDEGG